LLLHLNKLTIKSEKPGFLGLPDLSNQPKPTTTTAIIVPNFLHFIIFYFLCQ